MALQQIHYKYLELQQLEGVGEPLLKSIRIQIMYSRCLCLIIPRFGRSNGRRVGTAPCRSCLSRPTPILDPTETHESRGIPL